MTPFDKSAAGITETTLVHFQALVEGEYECRAAIVVNPLRDDDYSDGGLDLCVFERPAPFSKATPDPYQQRKSRKSVVAWYEFEVTYHDPFIGGRTEADRRDGTWHWAKD